MTNRYIEAWKANDHINEALLDYLSIIPIKSKKLEAYLVQEFSRILEVRLMWLEENRVLTIDEVTAIKLDQEELARFRFALLKSRDAITRLIERCTSEQRIKGFKSAMDFVNYLVCTDSESRNKIVLLLTYPN